MLICSALYYLASLSEPLQLVRDRRFYPGKAIDTLPVWWQYLRRHYPNESVVLFADTASPVPWQEVMRIIPEDLAVTTRDLLSDGIPSTSRAFVVPLSEHANGYFRAMQRNLVEAIKLAYHLNEDLFWLDADAFLNTDIRPLVAGHDAAAPELAAHQMTMDSVCTYISAKRLHALDGLGIDLPTMLTELLAHGPTETRMHTFQEGGLYKLFGYGRTRQLAGSIELAHLSCYEHFVAFLRRNPLDTSEYRALVAWLASVDMAELAGVDMSFHDMAYSVATEGTP